MYRSPWQGSIANEALAKWNLTRPILLLENAQANAWSLAVMSA